jgi:hypothetical protein
MLDLATSANTPHKEMSSDERKSNSLSGTGALWEEAK